jgi:hypothetical protein
MRSSVLPDRVLILTWEWEAREVLQWKSSPCPALRTEDRKRNMVILKFKFSSDWKLKVTGSKRTIGKNLKNLTAFESI